MPGASCVTRSSHPSHLRCTGFGTVARSGEVALASGLASRAAGGSCEPSGAAFISLARSARGRAAVVASGSVRPHGDRWLARRPTGGPAALRPGRCVGLGGAAFADALAPMGANITAPPCQSGPDR